MGFDLSIRLNVGVDTETGIAFVWSKKGTGKLPFIPSEYTVPEKFRTYLQQRGSHFHSYIKKFSDIMDQVDAERFLDDYPDWRQVKKDMADEDYGWEKEDHDGFKQALKWLCSEKNVGVFSVSWSY